MSITFFNAAGFLVFGFALFFAPHSTFVSSDLSAGHVLWLQVMGVVNGGIGAAVIGRQLVLAPLRPLAGLARLRWADARRLPTASARGDLRTIA